MYVQYHINSTCTGICVCVCFDNVLFFQLMTRLGAVELLVTSDSANNAEKSKKLLPHESGQHLIEKNYFTCTLCFVHVHTLEG